MKESQISNLFAQIDRTEALIACTYEQAETAPFDTESLETLLKRRRRLKKELRELIA